MNLDQTGNYDQENQNSQNNDTRFEGQNNESSAVDHSISNNAEPDFGNDLSSEEFNNSELGNENLGNSEFHTNEINNPSKEEFQSQEDDEFGVEKLDGEELGNENEQ